MCNFICYLAANYFRDDYMIHYETRFYYFQEVIDGYCTIRHDNFRICFVYKVWSIVIVEVEVPKVLQRRE